MSEIIKFNCPSCDQRISTESSSAGASSHCPNCSEAITVPYTKPSLPEESNEVVQSVTHNDSFVEKKRARSRILILAAGIAVIVILLIMTNIHSGSSDQTTKNSDSTKDSSVSANNTKPEASSKKHVTQPPSSNKKQGSEKIQNKYDKDGSLQKWRISGIHLGMTKPQVDDALKKSLGSEISLIQIKTSEKDRTEYQLGNYSPAPLLEKHSVTSPLKAALNRSRLTFDSHNRLVSIRLDLELIKKSSNIERIITKDFAQQLIHNYGLDRLYISQIPTSSNRHSHTVYEAVVAADNKQILISLSDVHGHIKNRYLTLALVEPLSFGPKGSLLGLKFGMSKKEVTSLLKVKFGSSAYLKRSENVLNHDLPKDLTAYDIVVGKCSMGTGYRSFVVFLKDGTLSEVYLNSDQLETNTSCNSYSPKIFGQEYMRHFSVQQMKTKWNNVAVEYNYDDDENDLQFKWHSYYHYSVWIRKKNNKVKF